MKIKFSNYLLVAVLQAMLAVCRGTKMKFREYKTTDCEQLAQLFYNTVRSVNAKDYTKE